VQLVKFRRMRWGACGSSGGGKVMHGVLVGRPEGKRPLGRPDIDGRIILRWIFEK